MFNICPFYEFICACLFECEQMWYYPSWSVFENLRYGLRFFPVRDQNNILSNLVLAFVYIRNALLLLYQSFPGGLYKWKEL